MKNKIFLFSLLLAFLLTGCYDDYKLDYDYTASYFAYQYPVRTVIIDPDADKFEIEVGAVYGGKYSYDGTTQTVNFAIDDALITSDQDIVDMGIKVMPSSWYTLSHESEIVMKNSNVGAVTVSIDAEAFTSDPDATNNTYAIPFKITGATTDSVLVDKDFSIVVVKFKNEFDGRYYVKGVMNKLNSDGSVAESSVYSNDALVLNNYIFLNSTSRNSLAVPRIGTFEDANNYVYSLNFRPSDGKAVLLGDPNSKITNVVGAAEYDFKNRTFYCKYNFNLDGAEYNVVDTLIYSNTEINQESWK